MRSGDEQVNEIETLIARVRELEALLLQAPPDYSRDWTARRDAVLAGQPAAPEDDGPDHGEADPDYPPHKEHFTPTARSLNSRCTAPLRQGLHQIATRDGVKACTLCGAGQPAAPEPRRGYGGDGFPDVILNEDAAPTRTEADEPLRCDNCGSTLHLEPVDLGNGVACPGAEVSNDKAFPEPVIIPLDELMAKMAMVPLDVVKKVLALQSCYVIGPADKAVLDAMEAVAGWVLENNDSDDYYCPQEMRPPIQAELKRRAMRR